jgi:hypothetical protein
MYRFVINSLPKSGTNLVRKSLKLLPGVHDSRIRLYRGKLRYRKNISGPDNPLVPIGVGNPEMVPLSAVRRTLSYLLPGWFAVWHVPYSDHIATVMNEMGVKSTLMLRDPRDVVLSLAQYLSDNAKHPLYSHFRTLSRDERVETAIRGLSPAQGRPGLLDIVTRYQSVLRWRDMPFNYTLTFEDLIGPEGGGSAETQLRVLAECAEHLGIRYTRADLDRVIGNMYGGTHTFRQGRRDRWRSEFTETDEAIFKSVAGTLLIELGYEASENW